MDSNFIVLGGNDVLIKMAAKSSSLEHLHNSVDSFYDLMLNDVIKVMDSHPSRYGDRKTYSLCPRWQGKKLDRREIHVGMKKDLFDNSGDLKLGAIRITNNIEDNTYGCDDGHMIEALFRLSFHKHSNLDFITPKEFHDLYDEIIQ